MDGRGVVVEIENVGAWLTGKRQEMSEDAGEG